MRLHASLFVVIVLALVFPCLAGTFTDSRDGQTYRTVKIGDQVWMAQNLNYASDGSMCRDDKYEGCLKYGRMYNWRALQHACPAGWRIPSKKDYEKLVQAVGGASVAGKKLKSKEGWKENGNGTDAIGFSGLPAGERTDDINSHRFEEEKAFFLTTTHGADGAKAGYYSFELSYDRDESLWAITLQNVQYVTARCIEGSPFDSYLGVRIRSSSSQSSSSSSSPKLAVEFGSFKDPRDSKSYKTVKILNQTWMAANLDYKTERSLCYDNDPDYCEKYGRLYSWADAKSVCPEGWRLPTAEEYATLYLAAGGKGIAGKILKSQNGWHGEGNGTNELGFNAKPAGYYTEGKFEGEGDDFYYWEYNYFYNDHRQKFRNHSDEYGSSSYLNFSKKSAQFSKVGYANNDKYFLSVRCIKDVSTNTLPKQKIVRGTFRDPRDKKSYRTVRINGQTWMAENLNYSTGNSWCYNDIFTNCIRYGRLYDFETAKTACPKGWHLPSTMEFSRLIASNSLEHSGKNLKSKIGWAIQPWYCALKKDQLFGKNGTNDLGFDAIPAGYRRDSVWFYLNKGCAAYFWGGDWSTLEINGWEDSATLGREDKDFGLSVRCIQD